jgi:SpoVK/Ycf46/Vps4 family AAA+-type ATPase
MSMTWTVTALTWTAVSSRSSHRNEPHPASRNSGKAEGNLLVIGATNEPKNISPKILTGRFERKILIDNPNEAARRALIMRQLAQEEHEPILSSSDLFFIIQETNGRSAVNLERLVSTAVTKADGMPVSRADFDLAMEEEPSDFDLKVAAANREYDKKHGWRGGAGRVK